MEQQSLNPVVIVYPNPVTDIVTINTGSLQVSEKDISLYDVHGRQQRVRITGNPSFNNVVLDVSTFQRGVYIVRIKTGTGFTMKRIIKK